MKVRKLPKLHGNLLNVALLVFVAALLVFAILLVRVKLLQNAQSLGMSLVHSYAVEEELNVSTLENDLILASQFIDDLLQNGGSSADIQTWLSGYFSKLADTIGEGLVDFYAVIDGEIIAANPWEGGCHIPIRRYFLVSPGHSGRRTGRAGGDLSRRHHRANGADHLQGPGTGGVRAGDGRVYPK